MHINRPGLVRGVLLLLLVGACTGSPGTQDMGAMQADTGGQTTQDFAPTVNSGCKSGKKQRFY